MCPSSRRKERPRNCTSCRGSTYRGAYAAVELFNFSNANLVCVYKMHTIEGLNYTTGYAKSVVSQIIRDVIGTKATVFGKNFGIRHMIGDCSTAQWTEVVDVFA
eukprot:Tbor_TRINITY_DN6225_c7_g3::TRINITY_DN6225_c7_g3_i11::g.1963::m.1963